MGDKLVNPASSPTYSTVFDEVFPYYLSIGMTYDQFWDQDCLLVKAYRKADQLRNQRKNEELWLQGMYIYDAFCCVAPVLHSMAKGGTKPTPYPDRPYPITPDQVEQERARKEKERIARIKDRFMRAAENLKVAQPEVKKIERCD